ncbi:GGDEF domain-containing protein [Vibrio sp. SCSIO 43135]|uniref:GGDEF domain-containing protein n=1 Tax=Vibrio sp. SCSIO 43135 TaxID=2819096 RepID=UPI00207587A9|nr:GGDEF domain-containing protein [Vibrio sp. SCSIO 43135]USD43670.1 GGDEF domain-containing protein [Vibrio sp. SCSIO 43135]
MHSFLSKSKTLLILLTVALILANVYIVTATRDLAKSYSAQQNQATWFLFQLTKEFSELVAIGPYMLENPANQSKVWLKYELTWSRFDLLLNSRESDTFMSLEGARPFFKEIFIDYQNMEPILEQVNDQKSLLTLTDGLDKIYYDMIGYVNQNFRLKSPLYQQQMALAQELSYIQYLLMFLLFCCAALVTYILHQESLHHKKLAFTDTLTGIKNRFSLFEALEKQHKFAEFTVVLLDLNGFKEINDTYGHLAGDEALAQTAWRLNTFIPLSNYHVYRMGGDEFTLVLESTSLEDVAQFNELILACFNEKLILKSGESVQLGASLGFSRYPIDSTDINHLLSIADKNMYKMKFEKEDG